VWRGADLSIGDREWAYYRQRNAGFSSGGGMWIHLPVAGCGSL